MIPFDPNYRGMRFYQADLQLQTPADATHWMGAKMGSTDAERRTAAEAYIRRCYEVGLEVIAVTDHNFVSRHFIALLKESICRLATEFDYEIVLFPGFELTADVGKGVHVLAIFEPDFDLERVDHVLTDCGVPMPRLDASAHPRRSTKRLPEILEVVQRKSSSGAMLALVILPHVQSESGIFDSERIADWLQAEEFRNPDLLCVEVPKPPAQMSPGWQRLLAAGPDCEEAWRRRRPIACIMSSDAKALRPDEGASNYIGLRHTWIKMTRPSIEGLRQAFLDPPSRIRLGGQRPEERFIYPKVRSITVQRAAFLADQEISFSPNLNALIGGRGTGKSTLIEYLRVATAQEGSIRGDEPARNFQRLKQTIRRDTELRVVIEKEGQLFPVASRGGAVARVTEGAPIPDLSRFFPVRVLSQKEIYSIAEDREARRRLVDDLVRREMDEIGRREADLVREIRTLNQQIASLGELRDRERILETERRDFEVRLTRLKALEAPLTHWKGRLAEENFFTGLNDEAVTVAAASRDTLDAIVFTVTAIGSELTGSPSHEVVAEVAEHAERLLEKLKQDISQAIRSFEDSILHLLAGEQLQTWQQMFEAERARFEELRRELTEQGTDPDLYLSYQREHREREVQLTEIRRRIDTIETLRQRRDGGEDGGRRTPGLLSELHEIWQQASAARKRAATKLTAAVPLTDSDTPFVDVSVEGFGDEDAFVGKLREEVRDRRRMSDEDWDEFMRAVVAMAQSRASTIPPTVILVEWIHILRKGEQPKGCPWAPGDRRAGVLAEWLTDERLWELQTWRTPDRVRIQLYRQDGSLVGDLEQGTLSIGQRCTAILALVLAQDEVPIVIDQPEEDLDNEFIFAELVPLLRKVKEQRQVIVATHNANIPVNGDAELVVALEARNAMGRQKVVGGALAVGGLDQHAVKRAVEDIMEGSEEAFRRRFEKYGF